LRTAEEQQLVKWLDANYIVQCTCRSPTQFWIKIYRLFRL